MGTPAFAVPTLEALAATDVYDIAWVITQPDKPAGRGRQPTAPPVKEAARRLGLPVWQPETMRDEQVVHRLREASPDVIVVAAFGEILRPNILAIPPHGIVNVHASLLPKHRGASPVAGALLAGDTTTGITIMLMDQGMDTGPILGQATLPIAAQDNRGTLTEALARLGPKLLTEVLPRWLRGEITPQPQDDALATYTSLIKKHDGLVDWEKPAKQIWRRFCAYTPWPGLFTFWNGQRINIVHCHPLAESGQTPPPGTGMIIADQPAVATGRDVLVLDKIQLAGKRPVSGPDFLRGHRDFSGSRLG
ncbi:MAG: methionyl-tRNA formyltransferase [Chloroflexi bacterium]|nr:methionyl-tRNA formyltransferase [Chloroflexota bacterium]